MLNFAIGASLMCSNIEVGLPFRSFKIIGGSHNLLIKDTSSALPVHCINLKSEYLDAVVVLQSWNYIPGTEKCLGFDYVHDIFEIKSLNHNIPAQCLNYISAT